MIERVCQQCGGEFLTYPAHVQRGRAKYCSRACLAAAKRGGTSYERTPEHKAKMSAVLAGRTTNPGAIVAAANARRGKRPEPQVIAVNRERWTGEGNPKFKDGRATARYAPGFTREVKQAVIDRDGACVDCGLWDERQKGMHVHHLDGGRDNHALDNLVLLCVACHTRRHAKYRAHPSIPSTSA